MKKTCTASGKEFEITDKELRFYKKMNVPAPTICPEEQMRQLMSWRNEMKLYQRPCSSSGKMIISAYTPDTPFPVYDNKIWWGDSWDGKDYGQDFDFSKNFFEQFEKLLNKVPREGTSVFQSENCDFNGHIRNSRNCYLNSLVADCEDTHYSYWMVGDKDCVDCIMTNSSELCYECIDLEHCYDCVSLQESANCNDCYFSLQLRGCSHCIGCTNLVKKNYYIFNKPVSKEEFEQKKEEIFHSYKAFQNGKGFMHKIFLDSVHKFANLLKSENTTGDHLYSSKNCVNCFDGHNNEDCRNSISLADSKDVYSSYSAGWPTCELIYNATVSRGSTNLAFCYYSFFNEGLRYCDSCSYCKDCFGCIGLKHDQYCILNKQYSKEEYNKLLPKIIKHMEKTEEWGNFFPIGMSPFSYNESVAGEYFPLTKKEILDRNWNYREEKQNFKYDGPKYKIPDKIEDIDDEILEKILTCETTGKHYKIQKSELNFYRKMNLPIPRECPDCRHEKRINLRNPRKLWIRKCNHCNTEIQTTFAPERPEKIYCEKCYLNEIN